MNCVPLVDENTQLSLILTLDELLAAIGRLLVVWVSTDNVFRDWNLGRHTKEMFC